MITLHYINSLLTANSRAKLLYNTIILGKREWKEVGELQCSVSVSKDSLLTSEEIVYMSEHPFEDLMKRQNLKIKIVEDESFIGFTNT